VETAHVGLVHGDPVLKGIALWAFEHPLVLDLRVIESISEMLATIIREEVLAGRHLGRILLGLAVVPGAIGHEVLFVEGVGLVEGEFVVVHG
jgi:hypothetical protein